MEHPQILSLSTGYTYSRQKGEVVILPYFCRVCGKRIKGIGSEAKHIYQWATAFTEGKTHWKYKKHYDFLTKNRCPFNLEEIKKLLDEKDSQNSTEREKPPTTSKQTGAK